MDELQKALAQHRDSLLAKEGVVGLAIGNKRVGGKDTGRAAIVVFVRRKLPESELKPEALVPIAYEAMDATIPTDVVEVGDVKALDLLQADIPPSPLALAPDHTAMLRPIVGGISCARNRFMLAGTVGLPLLYKGDVPVMLSNNHVIALSFTDAPPVGGEPVRQPSLMDKYDAEDDFVANLLDWEGCVSGVDNSMDAAIAALTVAAKAELLELGPYSAIAEPAVGMEVAKSGRSSGVTEGTVLYLDAVIQVDYGLPAPITYVGQVAMSPMLVPGDSGSAIVRKSDNAVVALGFAGSSLMAFAVPISRVMQRFGLSLNPSGVPVEQALGSIAGKYTTVWGFDSSRQAWLVYKPGVAISDLKVLQKGKGYWIQATDDVVLSYGTDSWKLSAGWNLIGWLSNA